MNRDQILLKNKAVSILWIAFMTAILTYGFVAIYLLKLKFTRINFNSLTITLLFIGFLNLFIGLFIHRKIPNILAKKYSDDLNELYGRFMTLNIVAWALIESAAAIGLAASVLEKTITLYTILSLPALFALFLSAPNPSILKKIIR